jgi:phenylpyruvate tautomerase PptA (4-oxalocrotonate tautomerase family)
MPLVRISLRQGKTAEYRGKIADGVHRAMAEAINVPPQDRFQVITEHQADGLIYDPSYLGINRTDDVIFIQITLNAGRTLDQKRSVQENHRPAITRAGRPAGRRGRQSSRGRERELVFWQRGRPIRDLGFAK